MMLALMREHEAHDGEVAATGAFVRLRDVCVAELHVCGSDGDQRQRVLAISDMINASRRDRNHT